ncbi:MAG: succinylglutamate desuccinylase/aspartoacylase family protein [Nitrospirota bacterium]|nr:succinylglutamate desuccinylase/aspartoacylase family protein [Nitrospirota bacterium]MDH5586939.1 succinylglutamate desuccinylase/aspartoacylase family protein [Nitrospirota bacterium]MDH5773952.1 succinylglutamate desuccinylase/aspartoacylase family protein [Nitrospirota bacterium]
MNHTGHIQRWDAPTPQDVGTTVEEFLRKLGGPTFLWLPGLDTTRTRAVSTLLHGNESSGVRALHRWIQEGHQPHVNVLCFIGSIGAALTEPQFSHRCAFGGKDLNRCFRVPFEGPEGAIAQAMLEALQHTQPEALIDLHNTSGHSPAYGVTTRNGAIQEALTGIFCDHLIVTDLRLGTLMEATETAWPTVTIEAGWAQDPQAHELAFRGFTRYALTKNFSDVASSVTVAHHPIRVELQKGASVAYATSPVADVDLTLPPDVDRFNFGTLSTQERLGWVGAQGLNVLWARDAAGENLTSTLFSVHNGELRLAHPSRLMMATTNSDIAQSDCLFYILPDA